MIKGEGRPLLFLHGGHGVDANDPLVERLAKNYKVIVPSHPGYGGSERPHGIDTVDDIVHVYLDLIENLNLKDIILVGVSFGGWIAAELATKGTGRFSHLVLIDALGVKFGDRESRDIKDIFATVIDDIPTLFFSDPDKGRAAFGNFDFVNMTDEVAMRFARNREALTLYGWSPTLYNPKLRQRLHRIKIPTLVLWGADDKVVPPSYGKSYANAIAGAQYAVIEKAGHYGYVEQPDAFADKIRDFLK
jgi:pimeloyl-ACP methyl ester carboxylesterase